MVTIPQNIFYIVIAVIAVAGLIIVLMQWRRVREAQSNVKFLEKQTELRKVELVERDLESKHRIGNISLTGEEQAKLSEIRKSTSDLMQKAGYMHSEINERLGRLEVQTEHVKIQKLLTNIEKKEKEFDKKTGKKGGK
jgi:23S rRNA maturation-related 3'-5' exoribonuclease YhaM